MSVETSKKVLKIAGILSIIGGVLLGVLGGLALAAFLGGAEIPAGTDKTTLIIGSVTLLISGVLTLLEGILAVKAGKSAKAAFWAWLLAILSLVSAVVNVITLFVKGGDMSNLGSLLTTAIISALIFVAANKVKNSYEA